MASLQGAAVPEKVEACRATPPLILCAGPPTTFAEAPGHRRPSHLAKTVSASSRERHDRAILWFDRKRRCGNVILHHRTVHPALIREWSTQMEKFAGAIWQSQRTKERFKT
ncbi:MAG: hypothetical protein JWN52_8176 [Actinomycetia bacterium]|nr:hypothetical protein [Actinomycetes bacterium]